MPLSNDDLKKVHDAVWHGTPGAKLIGVREPGKPSGWAEYVLGSMSDWIVRQQIAPLRGELAAMREFVQRLASGQTVDPHALEQAAYRGTQRALEEGTVDVDVTVRGQEGEQA